MRLRSRLRPAILLLPVMAGLVWLPLASGGAGSFPLLWIQVATFAILTVTAAAGWISVRGPKLFWGALGLTIAGAVISTVFSKDLDASVPALLQWLWLGAVALLVASAGGLGQKLLAGTLVAAVIIQAFWGFFVWWGGGDPAETQSGTFYAPNQYAGYLLLLAPLLIAPALMVKPRREAAAWGLMASLVCLGVVLSGSRGGLVALAIGLIATVILASRTGRVEVFVRSIVFLAIIGFFGLFLTSSLLLNDRDLGASASPLESVEAKGTDPLTTQMRIHWVEGAVRIGTQYPVTGTGLGTYGDMLVQVQDPSWFWSLYAHNHYAEAFAEGGIILAAGVTALPFLALLAAYRRSIGLQISDPSFAGLAGGLVAGSAHLAVDHDWSFPAYAVTSLVVTALLVTHEKPGSDHPTRPSLLRGASTAIALLALALTLVSIARGHALNLLSLPTGERMAGEEATRFAPYSSDAYERRAQDLESQSLDQAVVALEKAISLDTLDPRLRWEAAGLYLQLKEFDLARHAYREAIVVAPSAPVSYELAARFELEAGNNPAAAAQLLDRGLDRLAQHPQRKRLSRPIARLLVLRADTAEKLGDSATATLSFARAASDRDPTLPEAWLAVLRHSCTLREDDPLVERANAELARLEVPASKIEAGRENCD